MLGTIALGGGVLGAARGSSSVPIYRPNSDILKVGWVGSPDNTNLYANIDEVSASDSDYITSPLIIVSEESVFGMDGRSSTGVWTFNFKAKFNGSPSQMRVHLLDNSNGILGTSEWQTVLGTYDLYSLSLFCTGSAERFKIEVQ
jgi:hypothetical protein